MREETNGRSIQVYAMEQVGMEKVAYAAARHAEHPRIDRWSKVYIPLTLEKRGQR